MARIKGKTKISIRIIKSSRIQGVLYAPPSIINVPHTVAKYHIGRGNAMKYMKSHPRG